MGAIRKTPIEQSKQTPYIRALETSRSASWLVYLSFQTWKYCTAEDDPGQRQHAKIYCHVEEHISEMRMPAD